MIRRPIKRKSTSTASLVVVAGDTTSNLLLGRQLFTGVDLGRVGGIRSIATSRGIWDKVATTILSCMQHGMPLVDAITKATEEWEYELR